MKKRCCECGALTEHLTDGICDQCLMHSEEIVESVRPFKLKFCSGCKKLLIDNKYVPLEEAYSLLEHKIKQKLSINPKYDYTGTTLQECYFDGETLICTVTVSADPKH